MVAGFIFDGDFKVSKFVAILLIPEEGLWFFQVLFYISIFFIFANIFYNRVLCRLGGGKNPHRHILHDCNVNWFYY
jgi:hypothetical protein